MSGDLEKAISVYRIKDWSNMKLEGLIQGYLNNPPSPFFDFLAVQLAGTAERFTHREWVSSHVHTCATTFCRDAIREKPGLPCHRRAVPPLPCSQPSQAHAPSSNQSGSAHTVEGPQQLQP